MESERKAETTKQRLLESAARLLAERGVDVSTRAICEDAGVTAPTLYHYFGDRDGLLQAVVSHGFGEYLAGKKSLNPTGDPIEDIRIGWRNHQTWGTSNPSFYALMYGQVRPGRRVPGIEEGGRLLLDKLEAAARAGLMRVPPIEAARMILAANVGYTLWLISQQELPDDDVSDRLLEGVLASVVVEGAGAASGSGAGGSAAVSAIALKAALAVESSPVISSAELPLLESWLDRIAATGSGAQGREGVR
jgi:AcrR family transcriptional regulator